MTYQELMLLHMHISGFAVIICCGCVITRDCDWYLQFALLAEKGLQNPTAVARDSSSTKHHRRTS
jgi:hypothetical protein